MKCPNCAQENIAEATFCMSCATRLVTDNAEPLAPKGNAGSTDGFVGRQREMGELQAAMKDAAAGRGRLVMLAGEPGIGKTRLAQELEISAKSQGAQVLWGRCYEEEGAPPYWLWVQPLRSYVQQQSPEQLQARLGPGAAVVAEIVPEVREKLPNLDPPLALEPDQARFRLFDSITNFLKNSAQSQPLLLVLDDLHWADRSSLLLLEFLSGEIQASTLLILGTYRDVDVSRRHPLSQTLGSLIRGQSFLRLQLPGLAEPEVEALIRNAVGVSPPSGLSATIHRRTEGNPLFVGEIIGALTREGIEEGRDYTNIIPEGVRDAISRRLSHLSEDCNQVLTTASVVGREFDFKLLSNLSGEGTEDRVLEAFEEALAARVIEEPPGTMGRYQFTHALIQETLAQELSSTRRARLHQQIGAALEALCGAGVEAHAGELAYHFARAQSVIGPAKLAHYSLLAGELALAAHAYEDALAHFERGLVARDITLSGTEIAADEEAADLLFGLARAQSATVVGPRLIEAFATLGRAFEYYFNAGNATQAVAAAEFPIVTPSYRIPGVTELIDRALSLVPPDSHEAGRLLSRYGGLLDYEGAQPALERAITIARREGDAHLEVQALTHAALVSGRYLHWQESVDNGLRAIELSAGDEYPITENAVRWWTAIGLLHMGDLEGAVPHILVLRDLAERRSTPRLLASNGMTPITFLSCLVANWKVGRESCDRGLEISPLNPMLLLPRVLLEYETGEYTQGEIFLERLLETMNRAGPYQSLASIRVPLAIAAVGRITGVLDRLEIAEAVAEAVLAELPATPNRSIIAKAVLALLAVLKGNQSAAEEHYAGLLGQRGTMLWTVSSFDRLLGLLSQTMGNMDQAAVHFADALAFCRKAGYKPELAWTCCDYAGLLQQRNGPGDRSMANPLLDESLAVSTDLGMRPLVERVVALRERGQVQPEAAPGYPDHLTQREVEVLRLIAAGKTDREIAEELFITPRTAGYHVSNILNKTGSSNRTEAATYANQNGLV